MCVKVLVEIGDAGRIDIGKMRTRPDPVGQRHDPGKRPGEASGIGAGQSGNWSWAQYVDQGPGNLVRDRGGGWAQSGRIRVIAVVCFPRWPAMVSTDRAQQRVDRLLLHPGEKRIDLIPTVHSQKPITGGVVTFRTDRPERAKRRFRPVLRALLLEPAGEFTDVVQRCETW